MASTKIRKPYVSRALPPKAIEYHQGKMDLVFRPFEAYDAPKCQKVLKDTIPYLYNYMLWPNQKWDLKDCLHWVVERHAVYYAGSEFEWGMFDARNDELLGVVGIMPCTPWNPDCFEIAYWTALKHMKKGLATVATQVATAVAFECLGVTRMQAGCLKENLASRRVIEKCGFVYEGELRAFYPPPTKQQLQKVPIVARDLLYALLPSDCQDLPWYASTLKAVSIVPLCGDKFQLSY